MPVASGLVLEDLSILLVEFVPEKFYLEPIDCIREAGLELFVPGKDEDPSAA